MIKTKTLLKLGLLWTLFSCSTFREPTYTIGIDPTFFPHDFMEQGAYVFGFIEDLLKEIGKKEGVHFTRVMYNWDNLKQGLDEKQYNGMISFMELSLPNLDDYSFSDPILLTGPVLVLRQNEEARSFGDMQSKEIAVENGSAGESLIERESGIYMRHYETVAGALLDVVEGKYDGAMVPYLTAVAYLKNLYRGRLKIVTKPMTKAGIRLITLSEEEKALVDKFNHGFQKLKKEGKYDKLLEKWSLGPDPS
ncbi:MAG: transporter substrate-binding domain-containing protein [Simkaniaceae bacterium]